MKEIVKTTYQCEVCETEYAVKDEALRCEAKPVSQDKGVKVGDIVTIIEGDGRGQRAKVTRVYVLSKNWGHYAWERYWHTVSVNAEIIDSYGCRQLTFDNYETT